MNDQENTTEEISTERATSNIPTGIQLSIALGVLAVAFGISYIPEVDHSQEAATVVPEVKNNPENNTTHSDTQIKDNKTVSVDDTEHVYLKDIDLIADAAYVWDIKAQKALYKKNENAQLPLASLTKLMTALITHETLEENNLVRIPTVAINQSGESGLKSGDIFDYVALSDLMLISSSNDGAYALAAAVGHISKKEDETAVSSFITKMNTRAKEIGLTQTYFMNPTGLDLNEQQSGSYGSARDMAFLMEYLVTQKPEILELTTQDSEQIANNVGETYTIENTNNVIDEIPGLLGSKTGYTELAGGNLLIVFDAGFNHPVAVVVLGSTRSGRFQDTLTLVEEVQKSFIIQ